MASVSRTMTRFPTAMMPREEHEPNLDKMPDVDLLSTARTTRKTLERLAPFAKMRPATGTSALVNKIVEKINAYIELVDTSMHTSQLGYQLARDVVVASDPVEKAAGWDADFEVSSNVGSDYRPSRPNSPPPPDGLPSGPAGAPSIAELAVKGYEMAKQVEQGFNNISQALYKIAAATKESKLVVVVPPDPTHTGTLKLNLKDVATDLVANLSLLSEFSQKASGLAEWWTWARDEFAPEASSTHGSVEGEPTGGILAPGAVFKAAPMELSDSVSTDWEDLKGEDITQVTGWKANLKRQMTASKANLANATSRKRSSTMRSATAASRPAARRMNTAEIQRDAAKFAKWRQVQHNFEQYYRIINSSHARYPDLLPTSSTAWETVAPLIPLQNVNEEQGEGASSGYLTPPQQAQSMIHFDPDTETTQVRRRHTRRNSRASQTSVHSTTLMIFGSKELGIKLRGRSGALSYVEQKENRKRELNRKSVLWIEEEKKKEHDEELLDDADSRRRRSGVASRTEKERDEHAVPLLAGTEEADALINDDVLTKKTRWWCCS
ncbi:hypothetical protein CVT24_003042 [Panaeolus cyanescens]|uniref:Uncharacterized protein n=1 Tax=Panaeolus cyanescens TaxID=181874 RepID=A0A409VFQ2_9AGAR|nr:hypothetical protein CVT24_003042 [Panaeolus cyanescens]